MNVSLSLGDRVARYDSSSGEISYSDGDSVVVVCDRVVDALKLVAAFASIPAALLVPLLGGVAALLVFLWSWMGRRPRTGSVWTPIVISGIGILLGIVMLLIQLPVSAGPVSVDLPVTPV